jgi:hypothetical protein
MLISSLILIAIVVGAAFAIWELRRQRRDATIVGLLGVFGPAVGACATDARALLAWYPLAASARRIFPDAFRELDRISGGTFPFTRDQLQSAHARWTTEWLTWERSHDAEYRMKAAAAEQALEGAEASRRSLLRADLEAIERQKLESYQQRYEEYVRVAKALGALDEATR